MKPMSNATRTFCALTFATVIVLAGGGITPTLAADETADAAEAVEAADAVAPQPSADRSCGCCPKSGRAAGAAEPGEFRRGRGQSDGGCGMRGGQGRRQGQGHGQGRRSGAEPGMGAGHRDLMQATRALVHEYRGDIVREIEDIENGVMTTTRAPESSEAAAVLKRHVGEMKGLLESAGRMRAWDPLFSEIFDHSDEIEMRVEELDDGVRVIETSVNPEVVKLIRAHARKVNEFVARGPAAVHEPTALPDDYLSTE